MTEDTKTEVATADRRASIMDRIKKLQESGAPTMRPRPRNLSFISFDGNTGRITFGRDKQDLPDGQEWVAPAEMFYHGCTYWESKRPNNETRKRVNILDNPICPQPPEGEPMQGTLPKPRERDGWAMESGMRLTGVGGEFAGVEMEFGGSSQGISNAVMDLWGAVLTQADTAAGAQNYMNPIFTFGSDSYFNKSYDREIHVPMLTLTGWADHKGNRIAVDGDPELIGEGGGEPDPFA